MKTYDSEIRRRQNNPDMIELLPDTIYQYCLENKNSIYAKDVIIFCPNYNYLKLILEMVYRKEPKAFIVSNALSMMIYNGKINLLFRMPIIPSDLIGMKPDAYFIFEDVSFPNQVKDMWQIIRRFG